MKGHGPRNAPVTVEAATRLLDEGGVYLDVRTVEEFAAGHPPGAYNVPFMIRSAGAMLLNDDFVSVVQSCFALDDKLIVGCQAGGRSRRAAVCLWEAGFVWVVDMRAGFGGIRDSFGRMTERGWAASGLPTVYAGEDRGYEDLLARRR
ncbi:MAG: rhodanese-like domain-containing protein [Polyangiaceae bacterium]